LQLDREELDWQRTNGKLQKEKEFRERIQRPEVRREFFQIYRVALDRKLLRKLKEN
jgi:hypothetical protein